MLSLFISLNKESEALVCTLIFIASSLYAVLSYEDVYDLSDLSTNVDGNDSMIFENEEVYSKQSKEMQQKWSALYSHPLVISQVNRKAKDIGVEIKQFDHWEQFQNNKDLDKLLEQQNVRKSGWFVMSSQVDQVKRDQERQAYELQNIKDQIRKGSVNRISQ